MALSEEDTRKAQERAIAYRQMFESWAWKDFEAYLEGLRTTTVNDFIAFDDREAVEFKAGQFKGTLDCLTKIKRELEYIVSQ